VLVAAPPRCRADVTSGIPSPSCSERTRNSEDSIQHAKPSSQQQCALRSAREYDHKFLNQCGFSTAEELLARAGQRITSRHHEAILHEGYGVPRNLWSLGTDKFLLFYHVSSSFDELVDLWLRLSETEQLSGSSANLSNSTLDGGRLAECMRVVLHCRMVDPFDPKDDCPITFTPAVPHDCWKCRIA
jgi:hypothetical protein